MANCFTFQRRVEFCETDAAGIAHFSSFYLYMEQAEHALWRQLGLSVFPMKATGGEVSWPRVATSCQYLGAVRFEQVIDISVQVVRLGTKSITYHFHMAVDGKAVAEGETTAVCCQINPGHQLQSVVIPDDIRIKIASYVRE